MSQWDKIWINCHLCTCENGYGYIQNGAIAITNGLISWVGKQSALPDTPSKLAVEVIDANGMLISPGLIDCHTHLVYGGDRAMEFEMRLRGMSYEDIAKQGGGIQSTVKATRDSSADDLYRESLKRAQYLQMSGVTTVEIKSGYGLNWQAERKMLRVAKQIGQVLPLTVKTTFLGAHCIPKESHDCADDYIREVCERMMPQVVSEELADAVDVFCEKIAFNLAQTETVFKAAKQHGLNIKCHAEQLSNAGCAKLAANYGALSTDHLEFLAVEDVAVLAESGTVAVLLPGAYYYLRETQLPPIEALRQQGVPMAIATDCNPGTSPALSLPLMMNMACTLFRLTPEETLLGVTLHAAKALGMDDERGSLTVGKVADMACWDVSHPSELSYYMGGNLLTMLVKDGKIISV